MIVQALWRYPVKAMLGERLTAVAIGAGGCSGDRRWIVVDTATGERMASKRGPTHPALRACRAELLAEEEADGTAPPLRITLPDARSVEAADVAPALSALLGRSIRLERAGGRADGRLGGTGAHHDLAPIHLITTSTLAHLRALAPDSDWDVRRFRPNLVLDDEPTGDAPRGTVFGEEALVGRRLLAPSGLVLSVALPTPRCVVPTRPREELPADPDILRTLVEHHRIDLGPFGRQGCAGAYAEVETPGVLALGDALEHGAEPVAPRGETIAAAVTRLAGRESAPDRLA